MPYKKYFKKKAQTNVEIALNPFQAFRAMNIFLDKYYWVTYSDDLGLLLGLMNMDICGDGQTAEPAMWDDWLSCVHNRNELTAHDGYKAVAKFVSSFYSSEYDELIAKLIENLRLSPEGKPINITCWQQWLESIDTAIKEKNYEK